MEIKMEFAITAVPFLAKASSQQLQNSEYLFASHLESQMSKSGEEVADVEKNRFSSDLDAIKKKGFSAYVRDLEKEKLEKIREEILASMGLTEEDLAKLSSGQRAMIEEIIAKAIQSRLAASSVEKNDDSDNKVQSPEKIMPGVRPDFVFVSMMEKQENNALFQVIEEETKG